MRVIRKMTVMDRIRDRISGLDRHRPDLLVLIAGACSMGLEIVAGRMLAPAFGSGVYTWGSTIGVFLTALSLGYYLGGRFSDRASLRSIGLLLLGAASFAVLVLVSGESLIAWAGGLPYSASVAVLIPLVILFGPPTALIGFISPFTAELVRSGSTGEASGRVYALGTIGSIVGTFGTTFLLIPALPIPSILGLLAAALTVGAIIAQPAENAFIGPLLLVIVGASLYLTAPELRPGTIYHTQSAYQEISVVRDGDVRQLWLNGALNSAEYVNGSPGDGYPLTYPPYLHLPQAMLEEVDSALFIGGGAFSVPRRYADAGVNVTVVELDPAVVDVARRFFGVNTSRYTVRVMDGRRFLRRTDRSYDVIVLDAFDGHDVPFHMTTVEFMRLVREHLTEPGVVITNLVTPAGGPAAGFYRSELATMQSVFPHVYRFHDDPAWMTQNVELVGTVGLDRLNRSRLLAEPVVERRDLRDELSRMEYPPPSNAAVLRDSDAPVQTLAAE